eukprot:8879607-Pyramimonas_sp.AAC.1
MKLTMVMNAGDGAHSQTRLPHETSSRRVCGWVGECMRKCVCMCDNGDCDDGGVIMLMMVMMVVMMMMSG